MSIFSFDIVIAAKDGRYRPVLCREASLAEGGCMPSDSFRVNRRLLQLLAVVIDGHDVNLELRDREVIEAVLRLAVPVLGVVRVGRGLGSDPAAAAGDDTRQTAHVVLPGVLRQPHLLIVPVASHEEVEAVLLMELPVEGLVLAVLAAREMRDANLPVALGLRQLLLQPLLLLRPQIREELRALVDALGPADRGASGVGRIVRGAADVVLRVLRRLLRVVEVRVEQEDVQREALVGVVHTRGAGMTHRSLAQV
eukprot:CAMPEP_0170448654 /NCGR_PEP_ID=MMETSP0117_2-20130122/50827_1 /TAXON_ID=400756 /ORGANISM="Durinskia baltica, Strain CSIRO CS-38" /LENGTH=252 /DNA_ID=CAMNT_0010709845 /DNA_START=52 /DNA_END=810 /DNA_ORIENTATION=+